MKSTTECYRILDISPTIDEALIKKAFRKRAMSLYPDVQCASGDSSLNFVLLRNAYESLLLILHNRPRESSDGSMTKKAASGHRNDQVGQETGGESAGQRLAQQLNWLLWDIEDLFRQLRNSRNRVYFGRVVEHDLLKTLILIDQEILATAGLPDHFMAARNRPPLDPNVLMEILASKASIPRHFPYTSIENYFFDLRKRMNELLERIDTTAGRPWTLGDGPNSLSRLMRAYQNCVYNVAGMEECLLQDVLFRHDFGEVRALVLAGT